MVKNFSHSKPISIVKSSGGLIFWFPRATFEAKKLFRQCFRKKYPVLILTIVKYFFKLKKTMSLKEISANLHMDCLKIRQLGTVQFFMHRITSGFIAEIQLHLCLYFVNILKTERRLHRPSPHEVD